MIKPAPLSAAEFLSLSFEERLEYLAERQRWQEPILVPDEEPEAPLGNPNKYAAAKRIAQFVPGVALVGAEDDRRLSE